MKKFEDAKIEIMNFEIEDVVTTSEDVMPDFVGSSCASA